MFKIQLRWLPPAVLLLAGPWAQAQTVAASAPRLAATSTATSGPASKPDPLDAKAAVPRVVYASSLTSYRRYAEQPVGSWREANETVNRIGGWRAYAREASEPASAPAGHAGHKKP